MMFVKIYGVWRVATAQSYVEDFKEEAKPLIKKPWAKMADLTNWKTAYPDVVEIVGNLNQWCRQNKMQWAVYIIANPVGKAQLTRMFESGKYSDIAKIFHTRLEGELFLRDKGYQVGGLRDKEIFK